MKKVFFILIIIFLFLGCNKDKKQGIASIEGAWTVNNIVSIYGNFNVQNNNVIGTDETDRISESGNLGQFNFSENIVEYNFTRNDTVYSGNNTWDLQLEKVNSGFMKTNKWKLVIANEFNFDVIFEDATKNAEKKAKNVEFASWPTQSGLGVGFIMELEKQ